MKCENDISHRKDAKGAEHVLSTFTEFILRNEGFSVNSVEGTQRPRKDSKEYGVGEGRRVKRDGVSV